MTFVLKGSLEHFDTATNVWTPIKEGGFQVIQAGSGVMHSERIFEDSEVFQIWFDPDFSKSLKTCPSYKDYAKDDVEINNIANVKRLEYIGSQSKVQHQTNDINISREIFEKGTFCKDADISYIYSIYVFSGDGTINNKSVLQDDFLIIDDSSSINIDTHNKIDLFIVRSPKVFS